MPPAKKLKSGAAPKAKAGSKAAAPPVTAVPDGESAFAQLAKEHWLKGGKRAAKVKVKNDVIKGGLWDALEKDGFAFRSLLSLETLQTLEG